MREDDRRRATELLTDLYAAGQIDADRLDTGLSDLLAADSEADVALVLRELPAPVPFTDPDRRLTDKLEIHGGMSGLRLTGRWQLAKETHVSAQLGNVRLDLTDAELDDRVVDLHVYTGWGRITVIVPRGLAVQVVHNQGSVHSRLEPPLPGLPVVRLDATANIGSIRLRHPKAVRNREAGSRGRG